MTTTISLENVSLRYGRTLAVDGLSLQIGEGEVLSILGSSGCGKTSVLRLIAGLEVPNGGSIRLGSEVVASGDKDVPPERRKVGMLFQHGALFPHLNVLDNVCFSLFRAHEDGSIAHVLRLTSLEGLESRFPHELSGGQQQRVALARAIVARPRVMLLDEPFSSLDAQMRSSVRDEVLSVLRAEKITTILVTHDQEEALSIADRIAVMHRGRILQVATPSELYRRPVSATVARFLGEGQLVEADVRGGVLTTILGFRFQATMSDGSASVLLRPEELEMNMNDGIEGRVVARRFFGHDQIVDVAVGSSTLSVRCDSQTPVHTGDMVTITLKGQTFLAFRDTEAFDVMVSN